VGAEFIEQRINQRHEREREREREVVLSVQISFSLLLPPLFICRWIV
jgi:hypothetical protein